MTRLHWFAIALGVTAALFRGPSVTAAEVNPPLPTGTLVIADRVSPTVELARTMGEKVRGLSGRPGLESGRGMLFVFDRPQAIRIWMKEMRFSLDIVWIHEGRIVQIEKQAPPLTPTSPERIYTATADLVLEVPAGFTSQQQIRVGDKVQAVLP